MFIHNTIIIIFPNYSYSSGSPAEIPRPAQGDNLFSNLHTHYKKLSLPYLSFHIFIIYIYVYIILILIDDYYLSKLITV